MPHYIWKSNLVLIISIAKDEERKCHLTFISTKGEKDLFSVQLFFSFGFSKASAYAAA